MQLCRVVRSPRSNGKPTTCPAREHFVATNLTMLQDRTVRFHDPTDATGRCVTTSMQILCWMRIVRCRANQCAKARRPARWRSSHVASGGPKLRRTRPPPPSNQGASPPPPDLRQLGYVSASLPITLTLGASINAPAPGHQPNGHGRRSDRALANLHHVRAACDHRHIRGNGTG